MLSRLALMVQAAGLDGQFFDPIPPFDDCGIAANSRDRPLSMNLYNQDLAPDLDT